MIIKVVPDVGTNLKSQYYQISFQKMSMNDDNDVTALYLKFIDFIDTFNKTNLSNLDSENDYSFIFMEFKLFNYLCQDIILSDTFKDMNSEVHIQIIHNLNHFNENNTELSKEALKLFLSVVESAKPTA